MYETLKIDKIRINEKFIPSTGECIDYDLVYPEFTLEKQMKVIMLLSKGRDFMIQGHPCYRISLFDGENYLDITNENLEKGLQTLIKDYVIKESDEELKDELRKILSA